MPKAWANGGPSKRLRDLNQHVFNHFTSNPESVYLEAWALVVEARAEGSLAMEAKGHNYLSSICNWRNALDSGLYHSRIALGLAMRSEDAREVSSSHNAMGISYEQLGQLDSAYFAYQQSRAWGENAGDHKSIGRALLNMGTVQRTRGNYLASLENLHAAKEECLAHDLGAYLPNLLRTIGEVYLLIGELDLAHDNLHEGLRRARRNGKPRTVAAAMEGLGQHAEAVGDTAEALCWYESCRAIAHDANIPSQESHAAARVAAIYLSLGQLDKAKANAKAAADISQRDKDTISLSRAYFAMGLVEYQS